MSNIGKSTGSTGPAKPTGATPSSKSDHITEPSSLGVPPASDVKQFQEALHKKKEDAFQESKQEKTGSYLSERLKEQTSQTSKTKTEADRPREQDAQARTDRPKEQLKQGAEREIIKERKPGPQEGHQEGTKKQEENIAGRSRGQVTQTGREKIKEKPKSRDDMNVIGEEKLDFKGGRQKALKGQKEEHPVFALMKIVKEKFAQGIDKFKGVQPKPGAEVKIGKEEKQLNPEAGMKIGKEGAQKGLKPQIGDKSDKFQQPVHGKLQGQGEGIENKGKINVEEPPKSPEHLKSDERADTKFGGKKKEGSEVPLTAPQVQPASPGGPFGQPVSTGPTQQSTPSTKTQEMAALATSMLSRLLVSHESSAGVKEVRMSFGDKGPNANPNLDKVDVVVKRDGQSLTVEFKFDKVKPENMEATRNYINQNQNALNVSLQKELPDLRDIRIDIPQSQSDSQKDQPQGQSRGNKQDQEQELGDEENKS